MAQVSSLYATPQREPVGDKNLASGGFVLGLLHRPIERSGLALPDEIDVADPAILVAINGLISTVLLTAKPSELPSILPQRGVHLGNGSGRSANFPVKVSRWLGHKDGGQLAMKVYSHLRPTHSDAMVAQVSFEQAPAVVPMRAA